MANYYYMWDGKKKSFKSIKSARSGALKFAKASGIRALGIYDESNNLVGELSYDWNYESGYAFTGFDKNGKYFHKPLYKDGSVGPNRSKRK